MKKFCAKCQTETERNARGGCKPCANTRNAAYHAKNAEELKAKKAIRYANNAEKIKAKAAAYRIANPEKVRECKAAGYMANRDKVKQRSSEYYAANAEKVKARMSAYCAANPEKFRIYWQNRRAKKLSSGGRLSKDLVAKLFKLQRGKCACGCGKPLGDDFHRDHIMPLALGGTNTDDNMQLLRQTCNNQKHAKHPVDFMQSRGFLL